MTESADGASARHYCAVAVGDRVQLHSLKKENFNGRIGHVAAIADGGRFATTLSKTEKLSLKPDNLRPLPTPTIGVVIVGADESAGKELLAHILARRQDILLSRGAFIAVLALVGRDGAVHPQRRERALLTRRGESDAPHGGLSDATLDAAVSQPAGLASCPGYKAAAASAKATHRRLGPALSLAAVPSMVVLDVSEDAVGARMVMTTDYFRIERWGGSCVARRPSDGADETLTADCMHWQPPQASAEEMLDAGLAAFTGWLAPLVPAPSTHNFARCIWCRRSSGPPATVCGRCLSVCYCSEQCMLAELTDARDGALSHAAYCPHFKQHMQRDVSIHLPTDPQWLRHCMDHGGSVADECALLRRCGCHTPPYTLFCRCDGEENLTVLPPAEFSLALSSTMKADLPEPRRDETTGLPRKPERPLTSWEEYYAFRGIEQSSPIALLLSFPLTVYHALMLVIGGGDDEAVAAAVDISDGVGGQEDVVHTIHYLGAASREYALLPTFVELARLLPDKRIKLVMMGPNVPVGAKSTRFDGGRGGWLEVEWRRGLYHEMGDKLEKPTLAVAPNSGINEYEEWMQTIAYLDERKTPFVFTDYSEIGLFGAEVKIREEHGLKLSLQPRVAPFRQPLNRSMFVPEPSASHSLGVPWLGNGFVAALHTR